MTSDFQNMHMEQHLQIQARSNDALQTIQGLRNENIELAAQVQRQADDLHHVRQQLQQLQLHQRNQQQNQQQNQQSQHTEASLQYRVHDEVRELKLKLPDPFNGSSKNLRNFVNQIRLVIMGKPITYSTDTSKVVLIGNLLTGPALDWFSYLFEQKDPVLLNFENFLELFRSRFEDPQITRKSAERLLTVKQGQ